MTPDSSRNSDSARSPEESPKSSEKAAQLGEILRSRNLQLAVAESCTGGGLADAITNVPGSSDYFLGGVVSYSNGAKERVLGVDTDLLLTHGAVSEPVARAMANGVRRLFSADLAVGITGIIGPGGSSDEKPVGLVFIAVASPTGTTIQRYQWDRDRVGNKHLSVAAALDQLLQAVAAKG